MYEEMKELVEKASKEWTGLDWDSGPQEAMAMALRGQRPTRENIDSPCWLPPEMQNLWRHVLTDTSSPLEEMIEDIEDVVEREKRYVARKAEFARENGEFALEYIEEGDYYHAERCLREAQNYENIFGDCPVWGAVLRRFKELRAEMRDGSLLGDWERGPDGYTQRKGQQ